LLCQIDPYSPPALIHNIWEPSDRGQCQRRMVSTDKEKSCISRFFKAMPQGCHARIYRAILPDKSDENWVFLPARGRTAQDGTSDRSRVRTLVRGSKGEEMVPDWSGNAGSNAARRHVLTQGIRSFGSKGATGTRTAIPLGLLSRLDNVYGSPRECCETPSGCRCVRQTFCVIT